MRVYTLIIAFLTTIIDVTPIELNVDGQILKTNMCLQLKKGTNSTYINDDSEILRVLEIIQSKQKQIIVQSIQTKYYDYIDINDVRLSKCPNIRSN